MRGVPEGITERLEVAARVFADHGFDQTRIEDLAEVTGIPRATLYYYFAGKEDILAWLLGRMLADVDEAVAAAAGGPGTARDRLVAVVRAKVDVMARHPDTWRALVADLGRAGRIPEIAAATEAAFHAPVRRLLAEGEADGTLRPVDDPETTVAAVYGAVTMAAAHFVLADNRVDADRVAAEVTTFLLHGLGTPFSSGSALASEARSAPPGPEPPDRRPARGRR
jgi:TetR/AcrR family transcriptional regulator